MIFPGQKVFSLEGGQADRNRPRTADPEPRPWRAFREDLPAARGKVTGLNHWPKSLAYITGPATWSEGADLPLAFARQRLRWRDVLPRRQPLSSDDRLRPLYKQ